MKKKGYIPAYSKHFGYISYGYLALQLFIYISAKYSANFKLSPNLRTRKSNTTKLYYYDNNYYFVIPILFYVYPRFHSHYVYPILHVKKNVVLTIIIWHRNQNSKNNVGSCGQSSWTLFMWTEFMHSVHVWCKIESDDIVFFF